MDQFFLLAALAVPPGVPQEEPCPTCRDLDRLPPPAVVQQAKKTLAGREERLMARAPFVLPSEAEEWYDECATFRHAHEAWTLLEAAQAYRRGGDAEACAHNLAALCDLIGRRAWWFGQLPLP